MIPPTNSVADQTCEFLNLASQFKLGDLVTEMPHPKTMQLSRLAHDNLSQALHLLKDIDLHTLNVLHESLEEVRTMAADIRATLARGGRIFFCGCGATGRLSLALETLWRELHPDGEFKNSVVAFMAGGDIALIKAVEEFEDHPEYGVRQLMELGVHDHDLLISTTEGGETPFVIGATEQAAAVSHRPPYFLYCNPDDMLCRVAERSRRVIENPRIRKLNLTVGPMAISGSTRMQATTILMLAAGLALIHHQAPERIAQDLERLISNYNALDIEMLQAFIEEESQIYQQQGYIFYESSPDFAISILTDTTERAPTFSLHPFENLHDRGTTAFIPSLCYLVLPEATTDQEAWRLLLGREPRALSWDGLIERVGLQRLYGHDFSRNILRHRRKYLPDAPHYTFAIEKAENHLHFRLHEQAAAFSLHGLSRLSEHLVLKMLLNAHSTLVMGRLGRYEGNLMSYVRPSNNKLIDRVIRYVRILLQQRGVDASYEDVALVCFQEMERIQPNEPIVLHVLNRFLDSESA